MDSLFQTEWRRRAIDGYILRRSLFSLFPFVLYFEQDGYTCTDHG